MELLQTVMTDERSSLAAKIVFSVVLALFCSTVVAAFIARTWIKDSKDEDTSFEYLPTEFNVQAVNKLMTQVGHYRPPWWYSANLGTIFAIGRNNDCRYDEEVLEAVDGGRFVVSWYPRRPYNSYAFSTTQTPEDSDGTERKKIVFYVPGLGLSAHSVSVPSTFFSSSAILILCFVICFRRFPRTMHCTWRRRAIPLAL